MKKLSPFQVLGILQDRDPDKVIVYDSHCHEYQSHPLPEFDLYFLNLSWADPPLRDPIVIETHDNKTFFALSGVSSGWGSNIVTYYIVYNDITESKILDS